MLVIDGASWSIMEAGPYLLPGIDLGFLFIASAQKEIRLHRLANVAFFLLVVIALAAGIPVFADSSGAVRRIGWIIIAF